LDRAGWVMQPFSYERFLDNGADTHKAVARVMRLPNGLTLMVGRDVGEPERVRAVVRQAVILALGMMSVGALLIWYFIGRGALKRIDAISAESSRIIAGDLTRRLPQTGSNDEFDRLAASLNALLERIARLDVGVREVATNVAHDLRTPITRLRTRAELALNGRASVKDMRVALEACVAESDALVRTFNAILMISRLEAGGRISERATVALDELVSEFAELYEPGADDDGVRLLLEPPPEILAPVNRELVGQALSNLIENALRHGVSAQAPRVTIRLERRGHEAVISVEDNGEGVPTERINDLTERFVRIEGSRSTEGSGLGLSLVKAIADAHGGRLELENTNPGFAARLWLPVTPA
nr:ATP-binding protein [Rhizobiaceae bacterium]